MTGLRRLLAEYAEGARLLCTRRFWRDFRAYWDPEIALRRAEDRLRENARVLREAHRRHDPGRKP